MQQSYKNMKYDYLIVGAGLFGATFAYLAKKVGKTCLVIDQRNHIGGNLFCEKLEGIVVHKYGPHIFHTNSKKVYDFVTGLVDVHNYCHQPIACYKGEVYNLPFNMNTFRQMWNIKTAQEAQEIIKEQSAGKTLYKNIEEYAISMVGRDIYEKLIKGYTEKQWGMECAKLPASIIKRIPLRFTYDNSYFNDAYQFIPDGGYNSLISRLLEGIHVELSTSFQDVKLFWEIYANKMLYTGRIDSLFNYQYGELPYRSVKFVHEGKRVANYQGCAVMNFTDSDVPQTRCIEHRFFEANQNLLPNDKTIVTFEYPKGLASKKSDEAYYPINTLENERLLQKYQNEAMKYKKIIIGGRLGSYRYHDMDDTILEAMKLAEQELRNF